MINEKDCCIIYVLVGPRDLHHLLESIRTVRIFKPNIKIIVYSDIDIDIMNVDIIKYERVEYSTREENRNSSLIRLVALTENEVRNVCYLDNDIYVVNEGFFNGFDIAERYGLCLPQNPRIWITSKEKAGDLDIGTDVTESDKAIDLPKYMASMNMGVMFYCANCRNNTAKNSSTFLSRLIYNQRYYGSRGQASLYRTIAGWDYHPYVLPQQYCACRDIEIPLAIHAGNKVMIDIYNKKYRRT